MGGDDVWNDTKSALRRLSVIATWPFYLGIYLLSRLINAISLYETKPENNSWDIFNISLLGAIVCTGCIVNASATKGDRSISICDALEAAETSDAVGIRIAVALYINETKI